VKTTSQSQKTQPRVAPEAERPLSPARAFVVQFREETEDTCERFTGRVEHMISGEAARFQSPEELVAFLARVLRAVNTTPPGER